jgi:hypothetical protein
VNIVRFSPLAVLLLALSGCPFSSSVPLSDPALARPDAQLVGHWRTQDPESGEWNTLTILSFNDREMVGFAPDRATGRVDAFRVFPTKVGAENFLNFRELGEEAGDWYFARYLVADDRLRLKIVDDGLFENRRISSSAELREFIRQHLADPLLYASDADQPTETIWERVPEPSNTSSTKS